MPPKQETPGDAAAAMGGGSGNAAAPPGAGSREAAPPVSCPVKEEETAQASNIMDGGLLLPPALDNRKLGGWASEGYSRYTGKTSKPRPLNLFENLRNPMANGGGSNHRVKDIEGFQMGIARVKMGSETKLVCADPVLPFWPDPDMPEAPRAGAMWAAWNRMIKLGNII